MCVCGVVGGVGVRCWFVAAMYGAGDPVRVVFATFPWRIFGLKQWEAGASGNSLPCRQRVRVKMQRATTHPTKNIRTELPALEPWLFG